MDRQIRRLGIAFVALFARAVRPGRLRAGGGGRPDREPAGERRAPDPRRVRGGARPDPGRRPPDRAGQVVPNHDDDSPYLFVRQYPKGELFGQLTGYYSQIYGRTGLEQAMNPYLAGTAPEFTTQNLTDIILGPAAQGRHRRSPRSCRACSRPPATALGDLQGAVVAIDPSNGDILAMYSNPGFDPQPLSAGTPDRDAGRVGTADRRPGHAAAVAHAFQELYLPGLDLQAGDGQRPRSRTAGDPQKVWPNPHHPRAARHRRAHRELRRRVLQRRLEDRDDGRGVRGLVQRAVRRDRAGAEGRAAGDARRRPTGSAGPSRRSAPRATDETIPFIAAVGGRALPRRRRTSRTTRPRSRARRSGWTTTCTNPLHLALIASAIANGGTMYAPRLVTRGARRARPARRSRTFAPTSSAIRSRPTPPRRLRAMMVSVVDERHRLRRRRSPASSSPARPAPRPTATNGRRTRGSRRSRRPDRGRRHASP